jgi:hypothetical protein
VKTAVRLRAMLILCVTAYMASSVAVAHAAPVGDDVNSVASIQISSLTVQLILSMVIPLVVGLLTKISTSSGVKAVLMLVLNAVQTLIVQATMADGTAIIDQSTFIAWALALVVSVATYFGVYKPLNITSSTPDGKLAPNSGPL